MADLLLANQAPSFDNKPSDIIPPADRNDLSIDDDYLYSFLKQSFHECVRYKEYTGWVTKREYDLQAYYMQKEYAWSQYPWKGASSYRSPLTATLTDTAWAYLFASVWPDSGRPADIKSLGKQNVRISKILSEYINDDIENRQNLRPVTSQNIFRMFLNGTGVVKTRLGLDGQTIIHSSVSVEDIYVPNYATGFKLDQTEVAHQVIGLTKSELEMRRLSGVYDIQENEIAPGFFLTGSTFREKMRTDMDYISGVDTLAENRNNIYYIVESYVTFYNKNSIRPQEMIVWWAPNGGKILRKRLNTRKKRPFSRHVVYDYPGRFYGMSLAEKIKEIQLKLDYADKQYTDAIDRANSPAMFLDDTSSFDPDIAQRVPNGIYPIGIGNKIIFEPQPIVDHSADQERYNLWSQAEKLTGLIDVVQGASTKSGRTLGETEIRQSAASTRFSTLFKQYEVGFSDTLEITYDLIDENIPRSKKISLIGYADYQTIGEVFPSDKDIQTGFGLDYTPKFGFSGRPISERQQEMMDFIDYYNTAMLNPVVANNPVNCARLLREYAERKGIKNHGALVSRIKEENILTPEEFIQRVMSGEYNLELRPGIDADNYILELEIFTRTDMFKNMEQAGQVTILKALKQATIISVMEHRALMDVENMRLATQMRGAAPAMMQQEAQPQLGVA